MTATAVLLLLIPVTRAAKNFPPSDASNNYFAHDFAHNILACLPDDAIFFVGGDNDTYPLRYLQVVEGFRADVEVLNINLQVSPTVGDKYLLVQDQLLLRILSDNHWRRPICVAATVGPQMLPCLSPYLRLDGLSYRLDPLTSPPLNEARARECLLEQGSFRSYADSHVALDVDSQKMAWNYYAALMV